MFAFLVAVLAVLATCVISFFGTGSSVGRSLSLSHGKSLSASGLSFASSEAFSKP